jgi:plastocyanin
MKKLIVVAAFIFCLAFLALSAPAQRPTRITFARRATSAIASGTLNSYRSSKTYVIRVRAGQTLRTEQVGGLHDITIYITPPSGEDVGDSDASCNNRHEITPTEAGDYRIIVVECKKADAWRGQFKFRVTVR